MADPLNPSFETAGAAAGQADDWTEGCSSPTGEDVAIFDTAAAGDRPMEDFETQHQLPETALATYNEDSIEEFEDTDLSDALFDGADTQERFGGGFRLPDTLGTSWNQYSKTVFDHTDLDVAMFDAGAEDHEDFDSDFDLPEGLATQEASQKYTDAPDPNVPPPPLATLGTALFDTGVNTEETFDDATGWGTTNEMYPTASSQAMFDGGANPQEDYEGVWTSVMVE